MTQRDLVTLSLRLLAFLLGSQTITAAATVPVFLGSMTQGGASFPLAWAGTLVPAAWAVAMFVFAPRLARLIAADESLQVPVDAWRTVDRRDTFRLALRVVGAFAVVWAVPEVVGHGLWRIEVLSMHRSAQWMTLVPPLCKLLIGLYLLRGGSLLVDWAYPQDNEPNDLSTPGDRATDA